MLTKVSAKALSVSDGCCASKKLVLAGFYQNTISDAGEIRSNHTSFVVILTRKCYIKNTSAVLHVLF